MYIKGNGIPTKEIELYLKPTDAHYVLCMKPFDCPPRDPKTPIKFGEWRKAP